MIYALPGMGADHRMYPGAWHGLKDCVLVDWPVYRGETTLAEMAQRVVDEAGIQDGAIVIGASLGGMVACEITRIRKVRGLVLIGSATKKEEMSSFLSAIHPLVNYSPIEFIQYCVGKLPGEVTRMISESQAPFLRAMCLAIFQWEGHDESKIKPLRIHGRKDLVIPLPEKVDLVLEGGHLITMTHADECVQFLLKQPFMVNG